MWNWRTWTLGETARVADSFVIWGHSSGQDDYFLPYRMVGRRTFGGQSHSERRSYSTRVPLLSGNDVNTLCRFLAIHHRTDEIVRPSYRRSGNIMLLSTRIHPAYDGRTSWQRELKTEFGSLGCGR